MIRIGKTNVRYVRSFVCGFGSDKTNFLEGDYLLIVYNKQTSQAPYGWATDVAPYELATDVITIK